jgi:hypothetical protein
MQEFETSKFFRAFWRLIFGKNFPHRMKINFYDYETYFKTLLKFEILSSLLQKRNLSGMTSVYFFNVSNSYFLKKQHHGNIQPDSGIKMDLDIQCSVMLIH